MLLERRKMINKIEQIILQIGEGVYIDYVDGNFIVENKNFVEGKATPIRIQGVGSTLENAIENFVYRSSRLKKKEKSVDLQEDFDWYSSH